MEEPVRLDVKARLINDWVASVEGEKLVYKDINHHF